MASVGILEILLALLFFISVLLFTFRSNINGLPWNWPFLGTVPTIIYHAHRIHDRCTEILDQTGCTFLFKGFWFFNIDMLLTSDPANIHHIMSTNFTTYPKGPEFKYIFDILGDGIFNSDFDLWKNQRKVAHSLINHPKFYQFLVRTSKANLEKGLIPVLEHVAKQGIVVDLQDLFQRLTFDSTCCLVTGFDPRSLSIEFPEVPFSKAMDEAEEVLFYRHFVPKNLWEFQKLLGFGQAKKFSNALEILDQTISKLISMKKQKLIKNQTQFKLEDLDQEDGVDDHDLITSYMDIEDHKNDDKFLRDTIMNFMVAGRDTTSSGLSWFFYLLSKNPSVQIKLREELKKIIPEKEAQKFELFNIEDLNKLVYLHGALCESLRLYPPVPFQHKEPLKEDILPSGHIVNPKVKVLFSIYAMGRMRSVWGKDCEEFKPERWISEKGKVKHEPSYKFMAFNAGPRTCLGKEVAFTQMKLVVAAMVHNYDIKIVEGQNVAASASIILHMKHGLKIRVSKRWA